MDTATLPARPGADAAFPAARRPIITASRMAGWWGLAPVGAIESPSCDLGAAHFVLDGRAEMSVTCDPDPETHILGVHLRGGLRNVFSADGVVRFRGAHRDGDVVLIPAGQRPVAVLEDQGAAEIMHLYIPDALVRRCAAETPGGGEHCEITENFVREDSATLRAAMLVRDEMRTPGLASSLLLDSIAAVLAVGMLRRWSNLAIPQAASRGGFASWQVRRAKDILTDRLAEEVRLDDLATAVGLSTFHFARSFKQSTGMAPHQFQVRLRLGRAREMLVGTDLGVLQVALAVGYESGQALARAFRREFGAAPAEFHRDAMAP